MAGARKEFTIHYSNTRRSECNYLQCVGRRRNGFTIRSRQRDECTMHGLEEGKNLLFTLVREGMNVQYTKR